MSDEGGKPSGPVDEHADGGVDLTRTEAAAQRDRRLREHEAHQRLDLEHPDDRRPVELRAIEAVDGLNTLIDYRYQQHFKADRGTNGMGRNRAGANGRDITIKVPPGTEILVDGTTGEVRALAGAETRPVVEP